MKNLVYVFCIALCFIALSCQTEDAPLVEQELNFSKQLGEKVQIQENDFNNQNLQRGGSSSATFELRMQWLSFITAKLIRANTSYQNEISNLLGSGDTIAADELIGDGPFTSTFHSDFRTLLIEYIDYSMPDPDDEPGEPDPPGTEPLTGIAAEAFADEIIDYLSEENCVELYFPKGFVYIPLNNPTITSTAHPLTTADSNYGFVRFYSKFISEKYPGGVYTLDVTVDPAYVASSSNDVIIVARPYRLGPFEPECQYTEFSGIDFTDFLPAL